MWRSSAVSAKRTTPTVASPPTHDAVNEQKLQSSFRRGPPGSPISTLEEALKPNPFKSETNLDRERPRNAEITQPDSVQSLNADLLILADIYPDVHVEVLRELLQRFDGESRLHICTEQLVKYKSRWAKGQFLNPPRDANIPIPVEDLFRSKSYTLASRRALSIEFKSLNKSAVNAVLAEVNHSYTKARPVLQGIAAKSWRTTITAFFRRRKVADDIPGFLLEKGRLKLGLQSTGDAELDEEVETLFLSATRAHQQRQQDLADSELALAINYREAEQAQALFECQICYDDTPFENILACTNGSHNICVACVRRSVHEALFGQGWAQSIDVVHGSLRCLAPDTDGRCNGYVSQVLLERAISTADAGSETWAKLEERLFAESLMRSGLHLTRCPFCFYAEHSHVYTVSTAKSIHWDYRPQQITSALILLFFLLVLLSPILCIFISFMAVFRPGTLTQHFFTSLINHHQAIQSKRFRCRNPACLRASCLTCSKPWHDPHTCHEPLILSLRTAVEAARTAALKRTCPRCNTSFIKSSGCNKLTCVCGYAMCYLCRKNIGKVNEHGAVDDEAGGEGYRHFCEHFRPTPGQKCTECTKCDLYMNEDEELAVRKAGEEAEKAWRIKEGMVGVKGLGLDQVTENLGTLRSDDILTNAWQKFISGEWTTQGVSDWIVGETIIVKDYDAGSTTSGK